MSAFEELEQVLRSSDVGYLDHRYGADAEPAAIASAILKRRDAEYLTETAAAPVPVSTFDETAKQALSDAGAQCGDCGDQPGDRICPDCERCYGWYVAALRKAGWAPRAEGLSEPERAFLTFALGLAADVMASRGDEFTVEDEAALTSLRRMAMAAPAAVPVPDETETGVEYGIRVPGRERPIAITISRPEAEDTFLHLSANESNVALVQRTVRYGAWTEVAS